MARNRTAFSKRGLPYEGVVDIDALSLQARYRTVTVPVVFSAAAGQTQTAGFIINSTVKHSLGPVGMAATLRAAYVSASTAPAGGTLSWKLVAYDASANAEVVLTDTADPEVVTVREAQGLTIATTNVALAADDTIELHCAASNNAVGTDALGVRVTMVWETVESAVPQR